MDRKMTSPELENLVKIGQLKNEPGKQADNIRNIQKRAGKSVSIRKTAAKS